VDNSNEHRRKMNAANRLGREGLILQNKRRIYPADDSKDFLPAVLPAEDWPVPSLAHCKQVHIALQGTPACNTIMINFK
jgi:hypothetical protein